MQVRPVRARRLVAAACALTMGATAFTVLAEDAPLQPAGKAASSSSGGGKPHYDPENRTALSLWMEACVAGNKMFLANDVAGAIDQYRKAIQLAPKNPLGHYLLAEAQLRVPNLAEAEAALKQADLASDDKNPNMRAKVLFLEADVYEREKKWADAKTAWQAYQEYAAKHGDAGVAPSSAQSRIQAIEDMLKQDKLYEAVRQRIADEQHAAAAAATPDAGKWPAAPPKKPITR